MKVLKIFLVSIAVLIGVLAIAAIIFIKTFDVNRYKAQIISQAGKALSRQVDFQRASLGISLSQGISLKVADLAVSEDPAFGPGNFLEVKNISIGVDVLGYLTQKKISVTGVIIDSPKITVIRLKDGSINVQTIAKPAQAAKEPVKADPAAVAAAIPAFLVSSIKAVNGAVTYIDRSFEPPLRLDVVDLISTVSRVSLTAPFPFAVEANVLASKRNIRIEGKAGFDLATGEITVTGLKGATELAEIMMSKVPAAFPMTKGAVLPSSLKGGLSLTMDKLTAGPQGLGALSADGELADGAMQFKELASPVQNIVASVNISDKRISLVKASAGMGGGLVNATGAIEDYLAKQEYGLNADIKDLKLEELLAQDKSPVKIEGIVAGTIKIKGSGFSPEALKTTLSGDGNFSVVQARLKDLNVLRTVLDKISVIPGLSQKIEAGLPDKYKQKLDSKDTVLSDIKLPMTIENGKIILNDVNISADEFIFKGSGEAALDGAYSLEGSFLIPQELSAAMISSVSQLQYLLNGENQIYIPLRISGKAPEMKFKVDPQYITQKLLVNQGTQQLFKVIEKAVGSKSSSTTDQNSTAGQASGGQSTTEEAIGNLLGNIFKKK
jgi:hypothetical protein